jgi:hypothetical protein
VAEFYKFRRFAYTRSLEDSLSGADLYVLHYQPEREERLECDVDDDAVRNDARSNRGSP